MSLDGSRIFDAGNTVRASFQPFSGPSLNAPQEATIARNSGNATEKASLPAKSFFEEVSCPNSDPYPFACKARSGRWSTYPFAILCSTLNAEKVNGTGRSALSQFAENGKNPSQGRLAESAQYSDDDCMSSSSDEEVDFFENIVRV